MRKVMVWRWAFFVVGMMILSLGITMTIKGQRLGVGPWDVLHIGLYRNFGLTIGSWGIILSMVIVISTAVVLKEWTKLGTWLNLFLVGMFIDLFNWLIPDINTLTGQVIIFTLGIGVMAYGVGIYVAPNLGAGPRDSLMLIFSEKLGISIKKVRTSIEVIVAIAGWLLGGPVGVGTVIIALLIGQIVHYSLPQCRKLLSRLAKADEEQIMGLVKPTPGPLAPKGEIEPKQVDFNNTPVGSKH
ncbi:YczE/YyaS/YitT family protein [Sporosarcina highlanderae]|uniref:YitT family protein n=1 Tax=Sporosarcina highlanderae TaxID=3035916 RepID=A0ABT8JM03_9BACL|nr:YitT family protein [Sporosarcina highlanderae]MDN4606072.1 YitT family protein [Sporosarcina highlanderae]